MTLSGDALHHIATVLRLREGDSIELFDGDGRCARATLEALDKRAATLRVGAPSTPKDLEATVRLTLLFAIPKGDGADRIVRACTELGVAALRPLRTERTVASPPAGRRERWRRIAEEAARQSGRVAVPDVHAPQALTDALRDRTGERIDDRRRFARLMAWVPERATPLADALPDDAARPTDVELIIGPEGGMTDAEAELARERGFRTVSLGPRILRTPTAAIAATALVLHRVADLG